MKIFDIETDGLLHQFTQLHCAWVYDTDTGEWKDYRDAQSLCLELHGEHVCGHNVIGFDVPALKLLCPWFEPSEVTDTIIYSRLLWVDILGNDFRFQNSGKGSIPGKLKGTHKLEAWGWRLGILKDDYASRMAERGLDPWAEWNQEMHDYCRKDVEVTKRLWELIQTKAVPEKAVRIEHKSSKIIARQEQYGFAFNEEKAEKLEAELRKRQYELQEQLQGIFKPFYLPDGHKEFIPKGTAKRFVECDGPGTYWVTHGKHQERKRGYYAQYVQGAPQCKVKLVDFNPSSRMHIANRLQRVYGWEPTEFGDDGVPTVNDEVLKALPWDVAQTIAEYLMLDKRLGQLSDGNGAMLRCAKNGRIYGSVNPMGTVTGRMSHRDPNVAQTPSSGKPWGERFRELYEASPGMSLVGCDADGLEQRGLGHFMEPLDHGAYIEAVLRGDKEQGTDAHTMNQKAIGLNSRDSAKTWFYAFIYGAGDQKLGTIVVEDFTEGQRRRFGKPTPKKLKDLGAESRRNIEKGLPALGKLVERVKQTSKHRDKSGGYMRLKGLDGRLLPIRGLHSALNTVIQSSGAVLMKMALIIADEDAQAQGWVPGVDYEFVANVHDEFQAEARPEIAEELGQIFANSITKAGEEFGFRCRLDGSYKVGPNWAHTH